MLGAGFIPDDWEVWQQEVLLFAAFATLVWGAWRKIRARVVQPLEEQWRSVDRTETEVAELKAMLAPKNGDVSPSERLNRLEANQGDLKALAEEWNLRASQNTTDLGTLLERQEQIRNTVETFGRLLNDHTASDQRNFEAIAKWTENFEQFEPLAIPDPAPEVKATVEEEGVED